MAALTRTRRGLISELDLSARQDGVPSDCVVNFDNLGSSNRLLKNHLPLLSAVESRSNAGVATSVDRLVLEAGRPALEAPHLPDTAL